MLAGAPTDFNRPTRSEHDYDPSSFAFLPGCQHRGSARSGATSPSPVSLRLSGWRRRGRTHVGRELPGLSRCYVPPPRRGGHRRLQPEDSRAWPRTLFSRHACSRGIQPTDAPRRRSSRRSRRRAGRHRVYPLHHLRAQVGRCESRVTRTSLVSTLLARRS